MIPGSMASLMMGGEAAPAVLTYVGNNQTISGATPYTFPSEPIGTAAADRFVVVAAYHINNAAGTAAINSVTIGGISAAQLAAQACATDKGRVELWGATVPTGTTGDIVLTSSASGDGWSIGVWTVTGLQSATPTDTGGANTGGAALTDTINVSAGGVLIAAATRSDAVVTYTWSGPTKDYDTSADSNSDSWTGASKPYAAAQSGLTVTCTPSTTGAEQAMVLVALR